MIKSESWSLASHGRDGSVLVLSWGLLEPPPLPLCVVQEHNPAWGELSLSPVLLAGPGHPASLFPQPLTSGWASAGRRASRRCWPPTTPSHSSSSCSGCSWCTGAGPTYACASSSATSSTRTSLSPWSTSGLASSAASRHRSVSGSVLIAGSVRGLRPLSAPWPPPWCSSSCSSRARAPSGAGARRRARCSEPVSQGLPGGGSSTPRCSGTHRRWGGLPVPVPVPALWGLWARGCVGWLGRGARGSCTPLSPLSHADRVRPVLHHAVQHRLHLAACARHGRL